MQFSQLVERLGAGIIAFEAPTPDLEISGMAAVDEAAAGTMSYIEGPKFASFIQTTAASALILPKQPDLQQQATERGIAWVSTPNPRLLFAQAIALFYKPFHPAPEIHPTAVIHPTAQIGSDVYIGPHVVIQAEVVIGNGVCVHPNVVIYPQVQIGDRTILHANCSIQERSQIGADCVIHCGAVIGGEGFGFVPIQEGWYKMEQSGCVVLEDGVEVGNNSTIDRPAVGETRIRRNTKIDNQVQIGHGCQIGENNAIAALAGLAGGVRTGQRVILGGQVGAANNTVLEDGVTAGAKAGLHGHIRAGSIVSGSPYLPHDTFLKVSIALGRLPEMYRAVKQLQRKLGTTGEGK